MAKRKLSKEEEIAEYNRKRIIHKAKTYMAEHSCPNCKKQKERKVVPLHEYGDPFMPSSVIIICKYCKHAETFAMAPAEQAKKYAEEIMGEGFKKAPDGMEDILIKS